MKVGIVGLGKMGNALAYRLSRAGFVVFGYDINRDTYKNFENLQGGAAVSSLEELVHAVDVLWIMVSAGDAVDKILLQIKPVLHEDQIIIDGGNSKYTDSIRRARELATAQIAFLDCGLSGGLQGRERGFCAMVGGDKNTFDKIVPIFSAIAAPDGYAYVGPSGAGHYAKMIHNGIEYALLQSYAEGFHLLKDGAFKNLDIVQVATLWQHGALIDSRLLECFVDVLRNDDAIDRVSGQVGETGTGAWTVEMAEQAQIPVPLMARALEIRRESQVSGGSYATKLIALVRHTFGGHPVGRL